MKDIRSGFTLVEIMIVVAIIAFLAVLAVPSFLKARQSARLSACINNLRLIDHAKEQWATSCNHNNGDAVVVTEINTYLRSIPVCPSGGAYTYQVIGTPPTCSLAAAPDLHMLPVN